MKNDTERRVSITLSARTLGVLGIAVLLFLSSCGGDSDTDSDATSGGSGQGEITNNADPESDSTEVDELDVTDATEQIDADGDGEIGLEEAIGTLDAETRFGVAAGQLDPEPTVEINGNDVRMIFDSGSVSNAIFDCIVGGVTAIDGEILTLIYPDGEKVCS